MPSSFQRFNAFSLALGSKKHNLATDQLKIALCTAANAPVLGNAVLADLVEIAYTNLSTRNITTTSFTQSAGVSKLILADLTLSASGGPVAIWRYAVIYNDTAANKDLIGFYDYGVAGVLLADGENVLVDFDGSAGVLTIG